MVVVRVAVLVPRAMTPGVKRPGIGTPVLHGVHAVTNGLGIPLDQRVNEKSVVIRQGPLVRGEGNGSASATTCCALT